MKWLIDILFTVYMYILNISAKIAVPVFRTLKGTTVQNKNIKRSRSCFFKEIARTSVKIITKFKQIDSDML